MVVRYLRNLVRYINHSYDAQYQAPNFNDKSQSEYVERVPWGCPANDRVDTDGDPDKKRKDKLKGETNTRRKCGPDDGTPPGVGGCSVDLERKDNYGDDAK